MALLCHELQHHYLFPVFHSSFQNLLSHFPGHLQQQKQLVLPCSPARKSWSFSTFSLSFLYTRLSSGTAISTVIPLCPLLLDIVVSCLYKLQLSALMGLIAITKCLKSAGMLWIFSAYCYFYIQGVDNFLEQMETGQKNWHYISIGLCALCFNLLPYWIQCFRICQYTCLQVFLVVRVIMVLQG